MRHRLRVGVLTSLAATALAVSAHADGAPWLDPDWTVRRLVDAKVQPTGRPGEEVAVCAFYGGGMVKADGSDIRVAVKGRQLVPHRVLQIGPGDFVRVAFAATPAVERYYVYYGNPKAKPPAAWEPKRGVLLEVRRWPGGPLERFTQIREAWARAKPVGADFVDLVAFGFNPFAESSRPAVFHFVGWFVPPRAGAYQIATSSDDGSWLFVDGQQVVAWPGVHGRTGDARHAAKRHLTERVHRLDYWLVNAAGEMTALAAWLPPDAERFKAIPAEAFLPVAEAKLVETDLRGERLVADFFPKHVGQAWWPNRYAVRVRFQNLSKGVGQKQSARFEWDFGDGQTSSAADPAHIYLAPADYTVTLKASRGILSHTFRTKVRIERDWWRQARRDIEAATLYAQEVAQYDFQTLDLANLALAVDLFEHANLGQAVIAAASTLVLKREGVADSQLLRKGIFLARRLREDGRDEDALDVLRPLEERLQAPARKAEVAVEIAETLLHGLRRHDQAEKAYQRVLQTYAASDAEEVLRRAHIGLGDVWRHRGRLKKARQAYRAAAAIRVTFYAPARAAVRIGTLARYVEEYTRKKQWQWAFEFLRDWAWEFPEEKIRGHWSYLTARARVAEGEPEEALREALDLLAANPDSAYAVRLLILAAECQVALDRRDQARLLLQTAIEDYPEDSQQDAARKRLQALGGPLKAE